MPIRDEQLEFSPAINAYEQGVGFTFNQTRQIQDARFYINDPPVFFGQTFLAAIYAAGTEDQSGPISSLVIPCNGGAITGAATEIVLAGASTVAEAVASEGDGKAIAFSNATGGTAIAQASFFFNISAYPVLQGKRILGLRLRYLTSGYFVNQTGGWDASAELSTQIFNQITIQDDNGFGASFNGFSSDLITATTGGHVKTLSLGEVNHNWSTSSPQATADRMPWRYLELQRLQASAANRLHVHMNTVNPITAGGGSGSLSYLALEVVYCEELRLAYGGRIFGANSFAGIFNSQPYTYQTNVMPMRDTSFNTNPILVAGNYVATLSSPDQGEFTGNASINTSGIFRNRTQYPTPFALRELYTTPPHPGSIINIPFPVEEHLGDTFSTVSTHVLPQLSLHASGGTLTEPHVYGRQVAAQVYGANTATQDIYDDISGVNAVYPQVRYYARRFGDTTIPLTLTGVGGLSGSSASVSVADFDALSEIIDGWKEVTLRFAAPPTMGAVAGFPAWTWSATSETAGNRWEILGACAPAISGSTGNNFALVTAIHQLSSATYQPTGGATAELTWMPQGIGSPYVSGASADATSDAVLIFSQDPPQVTGVSLTAQTQTVTGIGFDCGSLPCCIPSGIAYQQIQWSATSLPSTGFGAYQLQRWDSVTGGDFETIMLATNPALVSFNDYEARVGITSVYRIRSLNALNFAGSWSTYVSGAPPTPGVTGGCPDMTGALIFTSNGAQSGIYNAAYVMQWDRDPAEDFGFPESDEVQFQPIYGRDGAVAFHGTERGLETFNRTVLLQAAAIAPERLADAATIRDLAWANLPYVCVRDDIGDRWFANVRVPSVVVRHNRTKYMARLEIVELTTCPYPVNP